MALKLNKKKAYKDYGRTSITERDFETVLSSICMNNKNNRNKSKSNKKFHTTTILCLFLVFMLFSSCSKSKNLTFDEQKAYDHIAELSSEGYEGRAVGSKGNEKAMEYIAEQYKKIGLLPFTNTQSYYQYFTTYGLSMERKPILQVVDKNGVIIKKYAYFSDFRESLAGYSMPGNVKGRTAILDNYDEMNNFDANKTPIMMINKSEVYKELDDKDLIRKKIKALFYVMEDAAISRKSALLSYEKNEITEGYIRYFITAKLFHEVDNYSKQGYYIYAALDYTCYDVQTANIVGFLPAKNKSDEVILISAHFDHVGYTIWNNDENSIDNKKTFFPGALDNASGVGALLSIAETISKNREALDKNIVFVAFNAEENGLFGSFYFVENPVIKPRKAQAVNLDMIGSKENVTLSILSSIWVPHDPVEPISKKLAKQFKQNAKKKGIKVKIEIPSGGSDHVAFNSQGIPSITLNHYETINYHTPKDTIDNIDINRLDEVGELVMTFLNNELYVNTINTSMIIYLFAALLIAVILVYLLYKKRNPKFFI